MLEAASGEIAITKWGATVGLVLLALAGLRLLTGRYARLGRPAARRSTSSPWPAPTRRESGAAVGRAGAAQPRPPSLHRAGSKAATRFRPVHFAW